MGVVGRGVRVSNSYGCTMSRRSSNCRSRRLICRSWTVALHSRSSDFCHSDYESASRRAPSSTVVAHCSSSRAPGWAGRADAEETHHVVCTACMQGATSSLQAAVRVVKPRALRAARRCVSFAAEVWVAAWAALATHTRCRRPRPPRHTRRCHRPPQARPRPLRSRGAAFHARALPHRCSRAAPAAGARDRAEGRASISRLGVGAIGIRRAPGSPSSHSPLLHAAALSTPRLRCIMSALAGLGPIKHGYAMTKCCSVILDCNLVRMT